MSKYTRIAPLVIAAYAFIGVGCTSMDNPTEMLGGQVKQAKSVMVDVTKLKAAYQESAKTWSEAKKAYAKNSRILSKEERKEMHDAAASVDKALNGMKSVRKGNLVDKAIVIIDLQKMQPELTSATETFKKVLDAHKDQLNDSEVKQYTKVIKILGALNFSKLSDKISASKELMDTVKMIKELGEVLKGIRTL